MLDRYGREIDCLRISLTDRCDLRCLYCMPERGAKFLQSEELLRFEEILRVARAAASLGVKHLRLTGGEPMLREDCLRLASALGRIEGIESIGLTTNGQRLCNRAREVKDAQITSLNVSLDALTPDVYARLTRGGDVRCALTLIEEALALGIRVKVNAVPVAGVNEGELIALAELARTRPLCVRFIELMPIGCARAFAPVPSAEVLSRLEAVFGRLEADELAHGCGPAVYVKPAGFRGSLGVISPLTSPFCTDCRRIRLTADGRLKLCLERGGDIDLRPHLRGGASDEALRETMAAAIYQKPLRHGFCGDGAGRETRRMNEIGG